MAVSDAQRVLQAGIAAARTGNRAQARQLLAEAVRQDPNSEQGWLWLAGVVDRPEETVHCLEQALVLNPNNEATRQGIAWARQRLSSSTPVPPPSAPGPRAGTQTSPAPLTATQTGPATPRPTTPPPAPVAPPSAKAESSTMSPLSAPPPAPPRPKEAPAAEPSASETLAARLAAGKVSLPHWEARGLASLRSLETVDEMVARGKAALEHGGVDEAAEIFRGAIARQPDHAEAHAQLAVTRYQQGDKQGALVEFENAVAINPNYMDAHFSLGVVYEELGETKAAIACWERVLELDPRHAEARQNLATAKARAAETSRYRCPNCNTQLSGLEPICPKCGKELYVRCENCGEYAEEREENCPRCGTPLTKGKPTSKPAGKAATEEAKGPQVACLSCGSLNPAYHTRCAVCGQPISAKAAKAGSFPKPRRRLRFVWLLIGLLSWLTACGLCVWGSYAGLQIVPLANLQGADPMSVAGDLLTRRMTDSLMVVAALGTALLLTLVGLIGFRRVRS